MIRSARTMDEVPTMRILRSFAIAAVTALLVASAAPIVRAQTVVKSGFNVFSAQQDVEIGRQSASQIERQLPMISDPNVARYVSRVGTRLVAVATADGYACQRRVGTR